VGPVTSPKRVELPEPISEIACGCQHVLALTKKGTFYVWGRNDDGRLGIGDRDNNKTKPILNTNLNKVVKVYAGAHHSLALTKHGRLFTWGWNECNALGFPGKQDILKPKLLLEEVRDAAAGWNNSMALKRDGSIWVW